MRIVSVSKIGTRTSVEQTDSGKKISLAKGGRILLPSGRCRRMGKEKKKFMGYHTPQKDELVDFTDLAN